MTPADFARQVGILEIFAAIAHPPVASSCKLKCGDAFAAAAYKRQKERRKERRRRFRAQQLRRALATEQPLPAIAPLPRVACACGATFGTEVARNLHATLKRCNRLH